MMTETVVDMKPVSQDSDPCSPIWLLDFHAAVGTILDVNRRLDWPNFETAIEGPAS